MLTFVASFIFLVSTLSSLHPHARPNDNAAVTHQEDIAWSNINLRELYRRDAEKPQRKDVLTVKQFKPTQDPNPTENSRTEVPASPSSVATANQNEANLDEQTTPLGFIKIKHQQKPTDTTAQHVMFSKRQGTRHIEGEEAVTSDMAKSRSKTISKHGQTMVAATNSVLAIIASFFNILMILFYRHKTTNLSSTLYLRNGVCDLVSAVGSVLQVPSVVSILDKDASASLPLFSYWIVTVSVRMSVFMNCVLGVVRCINILNPFYPVNRKMVNIGTILYFLLWTTIASLDLWFYSTKIGLRNKVYLVKSLVLKPEPGFSIPSLITGFKGNKSTSLSQAEVVIAQFLTPVAIPAQLCFALMLFQIYHLRQGNEITNQKKKERGKERPMTDTRKKKEKNNQKAATTILLVTTIYVLTSTLSIVAWLVIYRDELREGEKIKILSWEELSVIFFSSSTLPLLCSTLTPLTLLLRSSAMQLFLRNTFKRDKAARKQGSSVQRSTELTVKN